MTAHSELLSALAANHALLRELGLRYSVATDPHPLRRPRDHPDPGGHRAAVRGHAADGARADVVVVLMTVKQTVLDMVMVYQGTGDAASVRVAEVLRPAILVNAPKIVLVHNHPSSNAEPSGVGLQATRRIVAAAKLIDILIQDHETVARCAEPVSFKRRGFGGIDWW